MQNIIFTSQASADGPCKQLGPTVEEVANDYSDNLKVCKMDVDLIFPQLISLKRIDSMQLKTHHLIYIPAQYEPWGDLKKPNPSFKISKTPPPYISIPSEALCLKIIGIWAHLHGLIGLLRKLEVVPAKLIEMPDAPFMAVNKINEDLDLYLSKFIRNI